MPAPDWDRWLHARGSPVVISVQAEDPAWAPRAERREERLRRVFRALLTEAVAGGEQTDRCADGVAAARACLGLPEEAEEVHRATRAPQPVGRALGSGTAAAAWRTRRVSQSVPAAAGGPGASPAAMP